MTVADRAVSTAAKLQEFLQENKRWSRNKVAAKLGFSPTVLSQISSGKYPGDTEKYLDKIEKFIVNQKAGEAIPKNEFEFIETTAYRLIRKICGEAEFGSQLRVIVGPSGVGKTMSIKRLEKEQPGLILIETYKGMTKSAFLNDLASKVGVLNTGNFDRTFREVIKAIKSSEALICIDEAENVSVQVVDLIRRIHDFTETGMVLIAQPIFLDMLAQRQRDYAYIYNRTGLPIRVKYLTDEEVAKIVNTRYPIGNLKEVFVKASQGIGRDLKTIFFEALRVAEEKEVDISVEKNLAELVFLVTKDLNRRRN